MRIFCFEKNMYLNSIKNDHADGCRSGCGLIRSILGILELSSEKNHTFITIWKSWFSYEFPLLWALGAAELYREGSCCWRCFALTSLAILGHFPVSPDQQVMGS